MSRRALLGVDLEREIQEVLEHCGQRGLVFDGGGAVGCDEPECSERRLGEIGWLAFDHFDGHDS